MKNSLFICFVFISMEMCKPAAQKSDLSTNIEPAEYPVKIDINDALKNKEIPLLSTFSENVSYIKLKTPPNIFIKDIREVQIIDERIYIDGDSRVMVFDLSGNFIRQIGGQGRGPNEYINLRSFVVDKNNKDILLYTGNSGNIVKFNSNGELIKKLFSFPYADYVYCLDTTLVFSGFWTDTRNMPDNIFQFSTTNTLGYIIDSVTLPIYSINNYREKALVFSGNFPSTKFNDFLLLYGYGEDTIYYSSIEGIIKPRYSLDFGKYSLPLENRYVNLRIYNREASIVGISSPFETSNNLWMKFAFHRNAFILRYDKMQRKAYTFFYKGEKEIDFMKGKNRLEELRIVNDIDGGPDFFPEWSVYNDSTQLYISAIEAIGFKNELASSNLENREIKYPDKKDKLMDLVNKIEAQDDFILMVVKLK